MNKDEKTVRSANKEPESSIDSIIPFRDVEGWLKWKRVQESDVMEADMLFADPAVDPTGFGSIAPYEAADRANEIPQVLRARDLKTSDSLRLFQDLGYIIALVHVFGGNVDVDRFGTKIDLRKMMVCDIVTIILKRLKVQEIDQEYLKRWEEIREKLLIKETQLGNYRAKKGEDRVCNFFLRATYKILKEQTSLNTSEIKNIQKRLYTHFLFNDGARESWPCRFRVTDSGYQIRWAKYIDGKLTEEEDKLEWSKDFTAEKCHPGLRFIRKGAQRNPDDVYDCPYRKDPTGKDPTHCSNGQICKFVDDKIENWYKYARRRRLLK